MNDTSGFSPKELGIICSVFQRRSHISNSIAQCIHTKLCAVAAAHNPIFKDRGIKQGVAQVLLGAYIPAVLIEVGFVTNNQEMLLLTDKKYQQELAQSIANGVRYYCTNIRV